MSVARLTLALAAAALVLSACTVPSLSRLYSKDGSDVVAEPRILGTWQEEDRTYTVTRGDDKAYEVAVAWKDPAKRASTLEVHLVRVGDGLFADVTPAEKERNELAERFGATALPVHGILKLAVEGDELKVWQADDEFLRRHLDAHPDATPHAMFDDEIVVLTGSPAQVKSFIGAVARNENAFKNLVTLKRVAAK